VPRSLTYALIILFAAWLGSVAALLCFFTGLATIVALVATGVVWIGLPPVLAAMLIFTNTRVDWHAPDANPPAWGRRQEDKGIIETISEAMEKEASKRKGTPNTPDWFKDETV
jgi:hypothetical protein